MFNLPEIHGAAGGLPNVEGWARTWGVWAKDGGGLGKEWKSWQRVHFIGKDVISLGKEFLFIPVVYREHVTSCKKM